jgi:hypothetical protein
VFENRVRDRIFEHKRKKIPEAGEKCKEGFMICGPYQIVLG